MIEQTVDFDRLRWMRCGACGHEWLVDSEWLWRFHQGNEGCPKCHINHEPLERPDFWVSPDDPLHDDAVARASFWYHTSWHPNWPDRSFDPTAGLTEVTKKRFRRISGDESALERWAARQRTKALHLGTYEAAIENMLRRMNDQDSAHDQFYLYRVRLRRNAVIEPGVHRELPGMFGDVHLSDHCPKDTEVFRYVNTYEDPSSISLAVGYDAIQAVQRISVPLSMDASHAWVSAATSRLLVAAQQPAPEPKTDFERVQRHMPSALSIEATTLTDEVAEKLPLGLRKRFRRFFDERSHTAEPSAFPSKLAGLAALVINPAAALELLDAEPWREV